MCRIYIVRTVVNKCSSRLICLQHTPYINSNQTCEAMTALLQRSRRGPTVGNDLCFLLEMTYALRGDRSMYAYTRVRDSPIGVCTLLTCPHASLHYCMRCEVLNFTFQPRSFYSQGALYKRANYKVTSDALCKCLHTHSTRNGDSYAGLRQSVAGGLAREPRGRRKGERVLREKLFKTSD